MGTIEKGNRADQAEVSDKAVHVKPVDSSGNVIKTSPIQESYTGADCSGTDGASGRVLTLANTSTSATEAVFLDGVRLVRNTQYTVSHLSSSSTVTFLIAVWDTQSIIVDYYV